ncbi:MAG: bis(5'-nucleosyl)-tetraphosphatase (symmetrical) YqeK [bacterium]
MTNNPIDIREWIKNKLECDEERYLHSLGAEETARELAARFGADEEKAALAALIHDNAKCFEYKELVQIVNENNFPIKDDVKNNHKILHAFAGAYLAQKELGIEDKDILNAIMYHTTGRTAMSLLEKIVYLSDKLEKRTRPPEYRNKIAKILQQTNDIDKTILVTVDLTIRSLLDRKLAINSRTIEVWNDLII